MNRWLPRLALLGIGWCALTGGVFSGCRGLFTPATPEPPSGQTIVPNYRSPESTLNTMELGIAAKGQGSTAWLGAFADSARPEDGPGYHHFFDSGDVAIFESVCGCQAPGDWRTPQEQNFYLSLLEVRPIDDYLALFEPVVANPDPPQSETQALLHRHYRVLATASDGSSTIIAIGFADLNFTKIAADRWLLTKWEDHVDPDVGVNPTDPFQLTLGRRRLESTR